ncbi:hypothetical protein MJM95_28230, partial [Salmonella enterica subsp. enterica serovar Anatum]|nr:hypothetical protein [Salmonella enterica subsp. enterica serovar Anatum]
LTGLTLVLGVTAEISPLHARLLPASLVAAIFTLSLAGYMPVWVLNSEISRKNMLLLALMSSENRAAASLAHYYPGGYNAFIKAMN